MKKIRHYIKTTLVLLLIWTVVPVFGQNLKTADTHYNGGAFYGAATMYKELLGSKYRNNKDIKERRGEIMFRVAECYRRMNKVEEAEKWYLQAESAGYTDFDLYYGYGNIQLLQGNYSAAKELFQTARDKRPNDKRIESKIASCDTYELFGKTNNQYNVKAVDNLNTRGSEYGLSFFGDKLIFASTGVASSKKPLSERTGLPYSDLYIASPDTRSMYGKLEKLDAFSGEKSNEGTFCYDAQANHLYCTRCEANSRNCYIARVDIKNGKYKESGKLKLGDQVYGIGHPYITDDGKRMYFTSVMEGGQGGSDIWYADRDNSGNYGKPVNLGPTINTAGDEVFPSFIAGVLYFSSNGHPGLGGLDLFASYMEDDGRFSEPFNMRAPFNSSWDDFNLVHRPNSNIGLFVSNRNNSTSSDDIFMFENFPPKMIIFSGHVFDSKTSAPITNYTVVVTDENNKKVFEQRVTGPDGYFVYLGPNQKYEVKVNSLEYLGSTQEVSTAGLKNFTDLSLDTYLNRDEIMPQITTQPTPTTPITEPQMPMIEMRDIYYEFDRFRLTEASMRELDNYIGYFYQYPNMTVEISSHTDVRGDYDYNQKLSDLRAKSVVDYFVSRGVSISRMTWRGYGETQLRVPNARTEAEHQANRRTVFKVLNLGISGNRTTTSSSNSNNNNNTSEVRRVPALEILNSPGGMSDKSGWWLQIHESNNYRELDLPVVRRAGQLAGKEVLLVSSGGGKFRYCIQYRTKAEASQAQLMLYKEGITTEIVQFQ